MKTIRAICPLCTDEVDLSPQDVTLHVVTDEVAPHGHDGSRYGFECPHCEVFVIKPAGQQAVELLLEGGVELSTGDVAPWEAQPPHPEQAVAGPSLDHDDLLDFHLLLQQDDWFEDVVALCR